MNRNLKFMIQQITTEKMSFFFRCIQMVISLLILGYMIQGFQNHFLLERQMRNLKGDKEIYVLRDRSSEDYLEKIIEDGIYTKKFRKLVQNVLTSDSEILILNNMEAVSIGGQSVEKMEITSNFFEKYQITGAFDQKKMQDVFQIHKIQNKNTKKMERPVILGGGYKKKYQVGEIFKDATGIKYKVLGFLDARQYYAMPLQGPGLNELDYVMLTPVYLNEEDNDSMYNFLLSCQFFVKNAANINSVLDMNRNEHLLDAYFQSYSNQLDSVRKTYLNEAVLEGILGGALFLFSFVGMLCVMMQRILDCAYEYAVHLLCGARIYDIFVRIILEFVVIIMSAVIICFFIYGMSFAAYSALALALLCLGVSCIFAAKKIDFEQLVDNLRCKG